MIFDPMFIDTPVLFYTPDKGNPMLNQWEHEEELYAIKLQKETLYNYCETIDDIINFINYYDDINYNLEPDKKKINNTFFYYRKNICKHIIDFIEQCEDSYEHRKQQ